MAIPYSALLKIGGYLAKTWNRMPKKVKDAVWSLLIRALRKIGRDVYKFIKEWFKKRNEVKKSEEKKGSLKNPKVMNDPKETGKIINMSTSRDIIPGWIAAGDMCYIVAPTGVGKTTLAGIIANEKVSIVNNNNGATTIIPI